MENLQDMHKLAADLTLPDTPPDVEQAVSDRSGRWYASVLAEAFRDCMKQLVEVHALPPGTFLLTDHEAVHLADMRSSPDTHFQDDDQPLALQPGVSWYGLGNNALALCAEQQAYRVIHREEHSFEPLKRYTSAAVPVRNECPGSITAIVGFVTTSPTHSDYSAVLSSLAISLSLSISLQLQRMDHQVLKLAYEKSIKEAKQRDELFQVAMKFHAKIDVDSVLAEIVECIEGNYPSIRIHIYLSQDYHSANYYVKPLLFQREEQDICTRAFMEGQLVEHYADGEGAIAVPLSGKQGVYGVLQLKYSHEPLDDLDLKFIAMLAATAGTAFENAKLYEQSNMMVSELRLINEITKRLNQSLKLTDIFEFASKELIDIFEAEYCCILQLDTSTNKLLVQASNLPSLTHEVFSKDYGFSGLLFSTREAIIISDYHEQKEIHSLLMDATNSRSLIGSPILVNAEVLGVILVTHRKPNFFSYDNFKLLQVLSGHIGLAMSNASLHSEVRRMVITDTLTGLYARHYLDEQVNVKQKLDLCGSLIVVDIDNFKRVNDTYGHQVGDEILIQVAKIVRASIRDTDIAARWGGEELAVYLPQVGSEQTHRVAERIRARVANETKPAVTVSCGISEWKWDDDKISSESLFYKADMALYVAKHSGKNQIKIGH